MVFDMQAGASRREQPGGSNQAGASRRAAEAGRRAGSDMRAASGRVGRQKTGKRVRGQQAGRHARGGRRARARHAAVWRAAGGRGVNSWSEAENEPSSLISGGLLEASRESL